MKQSSPLNHATPSDYGSTSFINRSNSRKKWCLIGLPAALVLLVLIIVVSVVTTRKDGKDDKIPVGSQAIRTVCTETRYPETCTSTLNQYPNRDLANPRDLALYVIKTLELALNQSLDSINTTIPTVQNPNVTKVLEDCYEFLNESYDELEEASQKLKYLTDPRTVRQQLVDVKTWLSAAATFHDTCLEELTEAYNPDYPSPKPDIIVRPDFPVNTQAEHIKELFSILLSLAKYLSDHISQLPDLPTLPSFNRKLLAEHGHSEDEITHDDDPWVDREAHLRRVLQAAITQVPNAIVGKDDSANYPTIQEALDNYEEPSSGLYVIKILSGTYEGQVQIEKKHKNLVFLGSGMNSTTLTAQESVNGTGTTTFRSATLAISGPGFLATDLTVENTAGAVNHQAVAIRSSAEKTAFYRVRALGYQDTLYTHSFTQYYRNCEIRGTVDFVFGNGAAYFQECALLARNGILGQQNTYTAQGRTDPEQNTGLVFQNCNFGPSGENGGSTYKTYLGRPWKNFSRTILLENNLDAVVEPVGWLPWNGSLYLDTLFYAEYKSWGIGGDISKRVKWPGVHQYSDPSDVDQFLLDPFISGSSWIPTSFGSYSNFKRS